MALLCFVVDVSRLHGAVLQSIQQCLLQLVNFYVLKSQRSASSKPSESSIGLCLIRMDPESNSYKLQTIAEPKAPLKLRDFHQAIINGLNSASPLLESQDGTGQVSSLSSLLEEVSPWFPESATKRIVVISNCFCEPAESFRETVLEAARRCIMIDFIELDLADHSNDQCLYPQPKLAGEFNMEIAEFDNCTFQRMHWNSATISRLVKDWLQELGSDEEGSTEAVLHFTLQDDISKVFCTFYPAILKLNDILKPCEACRCHCMALGSNTGNNRTQCPITGNELDSRDVAENCLKIGDTNILQMPLLFKPPTSSSSTCHSSVVFTVVGCVCLTLLSESLLFGLPYVVVASSEADLTEFSESSNNDRVFTALCQELHSRDAGLLCTANIDMESGNETSFVCFYIFLPAQNNSLLAKRIATYEEVMPLPPAMRTITNVPDHVRESVSSLLSKMEAQNYDPIQHGRGIHSKLSKVVKESVEFRSSRLEAAQNEKQFVSASKVLTTQQQEQPIGRLRKNLHDIFPKQPTVLMKPSLPLNEPAQNKAQTTRHVSSHVNTNGIF